VLKQALQRCVQGASLIGGRALIVNAVDDEAAAFWQQRGVLPSKAIRRFWPARSSTLGRH
jgi:hypothetical protein